MDVDASSGVPRYQIVRQDLHRARQEQRPRTRRFHNRENLLLLLGAIAVCHRQMVKGNAIPFGQFAAIIMVGNDCGHQADPIFGGKSQNMAGIIPPSRSRYHSAGGSVTPSRSLSQMMCMIHQRVPSQNS